MDIYFKSFRTFCWNKLIRNLYFNGILDVNMFSGKLESLCFISLDYVHLKLNFWQEGYQTSLIWPLPYKQFTACSEYSECFSSQGFNTGLLGISITITPLKIIPFWSCIILCVSITFLLLSSLQITTQMHFD